MRIPDTRKKPRHARPTPRRARAAGASIILLLSALAIVPSATTASAADDFSGSQMRGKAHGGSVNLTTSDGLASVLVGDIAPQSLPCNPTLGFEHVKESDEVSSQVNLLSLVTVPNPNDGVIMRSRHLRNSGGAEAGPPQAEVHERARSADLYLLGGLITATAVQADAHSVLDVNGVRNPSEGYEVNQDEATGTMLIELVVDGVNTATFPEPNYEVPLPESLKSVMRIVLNEQKPFFRWVVEGGKKKKVLEGIDVNAIHVYVLDYQGYKGDIIVAHAATRIAKAPARISGYAYGSRGTVDPFLSSGKTALLGMPCGGTGGEIRTRSIAGATVLHSDGTTLLNEGTATSTVQGLVSTSESYSRTSSTSEGVQMFTGADGASRLSADVIQTKAGTASSGATKTRQGTMSLVNLVIDGSPIAAPVEPNRRVDVPGLGYVILNHQLCANATDDPTTADVNEGAAKTTNCNLTQEELDALSYLSLTVIGVHLFITERNVFGLPVGAQVLIAVSHADISAPNA